MQIAVASGKGGVGKSNFSASLAYLLSQEKKVIAIDADADTPNLDILLPYKEIYKKLPLLGEKVAKIDMSKCTLCLKCLKNCPYEAIKLENGKLKVIEPICEGCLVGKILCETDAISFVPTIPGYVYIGDTIYKNLRLIKAESLPGRPNTGKLVAYAKQIAKEFQKDVTILDSAAGIGCSVIASISGVNFVILILEPTLTSFEDGKRLLKIIKNFKLSFGFVINKYDLNKPLSEKIKNFFEEEKGTFLGVLPYDEKVIEADILGKPPVLIESEYKKYFMNIYKNIKDKVLKF